MDSLFHESMNEHHAPSTRQFSYYNTYIVYPYNRYLYVYECYSTYYLAAVTTKRIDTKNTQKSHQTSTERRRHKDGRIDPTRKTSIGQCHE